jgi:hypothetical protein
LINDICDGTGRLSVALIFQVHVTDVGTAMTRGDIAMNWDQIETKWAAMTRRIRADWAPDRIDETAAPVRRVKRTEVTLASIADRLAGAGDDPAAKTSAK